MEKVSFKIGDVVQLKSGGPKMTVEFISECGTDVGCVLFDSAELKRAGPLLVSTLSLVDPVSAFNESMRDRMTPADLKRKQEERLEQIKHGAAEAVGGIVGAAVASGNEQQARSLLEQAAVTWAKK